MHPVRDEIPFYLAAVGPKNLELAGELFDGWLAVFFSPEFSGELKASIGAGRAKVGKTVDGFDIVPTVPVSFGDDLETGVEEQRNEKSRQRRFGVVLVVRIQQQADAVGAEIGQYEAVFSDHVDVGVHERREARDVIVEWWVALGA